MKAENIYGHQGKNWIGKIFCLSAIAPERHVSEHRVMLSILEEISSLIEEKIAGDFRGGGGVCAS